MQNIKVQYAYLVNNIRLRRIKLRLTQQELAVKVGITQHAYSKIERGISMITLVKLYLLADALETDVRLLIDPSFVIIETDEEFIDSD